MRSESKKILLFSYSYLVSGTPGAKRTRLIIDAILKANPNISIDLITTSCKSQRSSYNNFNRDKINIIQVNNIFKKISMVTSAINFIVYAIKSLIVVRGKKYDLVVATSGRLMTAVLASVVARIQHSKLFLDIREIFPKNLAEVIKPAIVGIILGEIFSLFERFAFKKALRINLISPGFKNYYLARYSNIKFTCYTHSVSESLKLDNNSTKLHDANIPIKALYAGTIGYGQNLHLILPELAKQLSESHIFNIVGRGNGKDVLEQEIIKLKIDNIFVNDYKPVNELTKMYQEADILLLHVHPYKFSERLLPSKLFEYVATGLPICAGVSGYARKFISKELPDIELFIPGDVDSAKKAINSILPCSCDYSGFIEKYSYSNIRDKLSFELNSLLN